MSFQREREATTEQEPKPKVLVTFHGYSHEPLNLQAVSHVKEHLKSHLERPSGGITFFWEMASNSQEQAERTRKLVRERGVQSTIIFFNLLNRLGRTPTEMEVANQIEKINSSTLGQIIGKRLLSPRLLQDFFIGKELDILKRDYNFEFDCESHTKNVLNILARNGKQSEICTNNANKMWNEGNLDGAIEQLKMAYNFVHQITRSRDDELIQFLKRRIKTLKKEGGGLIFLLFGSAHEKVVSELQKKIDPKKLFLNSEIVKFIPLVDQLVLVFETPTDLMISRAYIIEYFFHYLESKIFNLGAEEVNVENIAYNYGNIQAGINQVVRTLSVEEIQRLCERKTDIVEFLRKHPLASPIKHLIS